MQLGRVHVNGVSHSEPTPDFYPGTGWSVCFRVMMTYCHVKIGASSGCNPFWNHPQSGALRYRKQDQLGLDTVWDLSKATETMATSCLVWKLCCWILTRLFENNQTVSGEGVPSLFRHLQILAALLKRRLVMSWQGLHELLGMNLSQ